MATMRTNNDKPHRLKPVRAFSNRVQTSRWVGGKAFPSPEDRFVNSLASWPFSKLDEAGEEVRPELGVCILIVDFQANIVFAIYRAFFEPNIAHISRGCELTLARC